MTEKEKLLLSILKNIEYYSEKIVSLKEDLETIEETIEEYENILNENRKKLEEV